MLSKVFAIGLVALVFTCAPGQTVVAVDPVKVSLRLLKALPDRWELEVTVENVSNRSVFVMSDPLTVNGPKGPYVSLADAHTLEIPFRDFLDAPTRPGFCTASVNARCATSDSSARFLGADKTLVPVCFMVLAR